MKLKSLDISETNYDSNGDYGVKRFKGTATFLVRENELKVNLPPETIQEIVKAITSTTLVACEVIGEVGYKAVETSLYDNVLEHMETTDNA